MNDAQSKNGRKVVEANGSSFLLEREDRGGGDWALYRLVDGVKGPLLDRDQYQNDLTERARALAEHIERLTTLQQGLTDRLTVTSDDYKPLIQDRIDLVGAWTEDISNGWRKYDGAIDGAVRELAKLALWRGERKSAREVTSPHDGHRRSIEVLKSAAGYYLGTTDGDGTPYSRESSDYWATAELARAALESGAWQGRNGVEMGYFDAASLAQLKAAVDGVPYQSSPRAAAALSDLREAVGRMGTGPAIESGGSPSVGGDARLMPHEQVHLSQLRQAGRDGAAFQAAFLSLEHDGSVSPAGAARIAEAYGEQAQPSDDRAAALGNIEASFHNGVKATTRDHAKGR